MLRVLLKINFIIYSNRILLVAFSASVEMVVWFPLLSVNIVNFIHRFPDVKYSFICRKNLTLLLTLTIKFAIYFNVFSFLE